jgi:hypothetical protein
MSPPGHDPSLARSLQPQMTVYDFAVAAREHGDLESEFSDAAAHAIDGSVIFFLDYDHRRLACRWARSGFEEAEMRSRP